ncbi:MAG: DNA-formamidopyrimidine glycosylase family protein [Candidatus Eisenbacteria bacterium]
MPEGDTIHRSAHHLSLALVDRPVLNYWARRPELLRFRRQECVVTAVEARGKSLLIHFDDGVALYSHMKMSGSWHIYRPGERWQLPSHLSRVAIENDRFVAVCFSAPDLELLTRDEVGAHPVLAALGPDLLGPNFDLEEALARFRAASGAKVPGAKSSEAETRDLSIGEAVLNQRIVAGIGNVWKSEMLFVTGIDPFLPVSEVADDLLRKLLRDARVLMRKNLDTVVRTTRFVPGGDLWVYERAGEPCYRCRTKVERERQGRPSRSTYFCVRCQNVDRG